MLKSKKCGNYRIIFAGIPSSPTAFLNSLIANNLSEFKWRYRNTVLFALSLNFRIFCTYDSIASFTTDEYITKIILFFEYQVAKQIIEVIFDGCLMDGDGDVVFCSNNIYLYISKSTALQLQCRHLMQNVKLDFSLRQLPFLSN